MKMLNSNQKLSICKKSINKKYPKYRHYLESIWTQKNYLQKQVHKNCRNIKSKKTQCRKLKHYKFMLEKQIKWWINYKKKRNK